MLIELCRQYIKDMFPHKYTFEEIPAPIWDRVYAKWSNPTEWYGAYWTTCALCSFVGYANHHLGKCSQCPLNSSGYCTGNATTSMLHRGYGLEQIPHHIEFDDAVPGWHERWAHRVNDFLVLIYPYTTAGRKTDKPNDTERTSDA